MRSEKSWMFYRWLKGQNCIFTLIGYGKFKYEVKWMIEFSQS